MADDKNMAPEEELPVGATPPKGGEGTPMTEEEIPAEAGTMVDLDVGTVPELGGLNIGDEITLSVQEISEDGNTYKLSVVPGTAPAPMPEEGAAPTGREAVEAELLS